MYMFRDWMYWPSLHIPRKPVVVKAMIHCPNNSTVGLDCDKLVYHGILISCLMLGEASKFTSEYC